MVQGQPAGALALEFWHRSMLQPGILLRTVQELGHPSDYAHCDSYLDSCSVSGQLLEVYFEDLHWAEALAQDTDHWVASTVPCLW